MIDTLIADFWSRFAVSAPTLAAESTFRADVVVYGATASGVIAAVAAAREGKTVILLDPARHVGGMVSGGLGVTDTGNARPSAAIPASSSTAFASITSQRTAPNIPSR